MNVLKLAETRKKLREKLNRYRELKKQRGMTLLEIIIVLGIIGTIAAGVVVLAQRAYDNKAITDVVTNTNVVRTAIKETWGPTGVYPAEDIAHTLSLTEATARTVTGANKPPIATLIQLGKLSTSEAKNSISTNFYNIGNARVGTAAAGGVGGVAGVNPESRAFFIEVNGLDQKQCRNIALQVGNQWDYVQIVATGGGSGAYVAANNIDLATAPVAVAAGAGVIRTLANNGNVLITPETISAACSDSAQNSIILGSR
ncbi:type II secretion system protein [Salmonella enterica subsp. enterica]|uniref:Type II secretion system protein n=1 Tax=Salmonella enterica I TaxID=59201 RepID=A0A612HB11_SALET|nr:type II secretion system protein [Salmonella enterica subsp. enterica]